ncbi:MAG: MBL fold metallo-hydrolase, partial [Anaerovoracaceae bacterium]
MNEERAMTSEKTVRPVSKPVKADRRRTNTSSKPASSNSGLKRSNGTNKNSIAAGTSTNRKTAKTAEKAAPKAVSKTGVKSKTPAKNGRRKSLKTEVKVIPLGGLHEIGKNMTAIEYEDEIIIIDCGLSFPDDDMFGIDKVIPDFSYLKKNSRKIKGMVITHGHEDHIGGIPYLLKEVNVPIYGMRFPLGLIENKLKEHNLKAVMHTVEAGETFKLGRNFSIEALRITHSIADSMCMAINTPAGRIFHTGDFKIDYTPVDGDPIDFARLAQIG